MKSSLPARGLVFACFCTILLLYTWAVPVLHAQEGGKTGENKPDTVTASKPTAAGTGADSKSDPAGLIAVFSLIGALSAATQRLVDLIKPWPWCKLFYAQPDPVDPTKPGDDTRFAKANETYEFRVHVLAVLCGIATSTASIPAISNIAVLAPWVAKGGPNLAWAVVLIGFLASSTSGPWNSIVDWLKGLKTNSAPAPAQAAPTQPAAAPAIRPAGRAS